jgi:hypothetical protein
LLTGESGSTIFGNFFQSVVTPHEPEVSTMEFKLDPRVFLLYNKSLMFKSRWQRTHIYIATIRPCLQDEPVSTVLAGKERPEETNAATKANDCIRLDRQGQPGVYLIFRYNTIQLAWRGYN